MSSLTSRLTNVSSCRLRTPISHPYSDGPEDGIEVLAYAYEEAFGEKLGALAERTRPRDLYDVINLYRNTDARPSASVLLRTEPGASRRPSSNFPNAPEMDKIRRGDCHKISREAAANTKDQEPELTMLTNYISSAMRRAKYEILADEGTFYGEIPGFDGIYADTVSLEACRDELEEVLEEWILFRVSRNLALPVVDGIELTIKKVV